MSQIRVQSNGRGRWGYVLPDYVSPYRYGSAEAAQKAGAADAAESAALDRALPAPPPPHPSELCTHGGRSFACQES